MLVDPEQLQVLKPLEGVRGRAEAEFYRFAFAPTRRAAPPAIFMPRFYGVSTLTADSAGVPSSTAYLALEDVTAAMRRPCVMDVKMGVQTWGEDARPDKAAAEAAKYPPAQRVGLRVTGMRVWDTSAGEYREHGRSFGYGLDEGSLDRAFAEFLWDGAKLRTDVAEGMLTRLEALEAWFESQADFRFYGSSLLFCYDGEGGEAAAGAPQLLVRQPTGTASEASVAPATPVVDVRMIDFAHVWSIRDGPEGRDEGYLTGLRSTKAYVRKVLRDARE
jgi:1D-myo-inositol-tetrakisphosphate 5-kinase/inositol-polyphosphate multikinase